MHWTVHTSAKARLTSVAIRIRILIRIRIPEPDWSPPKFKHLFIGSCQPFLKLSCKSVQKFLRKVAITNRHTDKQQRKHILLGGGNEQRNQACINVRAFAFQKQFAANLQGKRNEEDNRCHNSQLEEVVISNEVSDSGVHHVSEGQSHLDGDTSERPIPWTDRLHNCIQSLRHILQMLACHKPNTPFPCNGIVRKNYKWEQKRRKRQLFKPYHMRR